MCGDLMVTVMHGTTTVGLVTRDAVILAADKRASSGFYIAHKNVRKIVKIDDHVVMTISGLVADAQMLASILQYMARNYRVSTGRAIPVRNLASYLSLILNTNKYYPYVVQLLLGGYDVKPRLFAIEWFGDYVEEKYAVTGSGSPVAVGVIESNYRENLSIDEATELAVKAVRASMRRDVFTGEAVDVAVVTREGAKIMLF
ncbi:MAG: proteasome endopeptidase complex, archaeal, beta subunit [Desulfurococcales archaeon ex4484_204]|nr:MAG: proteasome endopeptidase complex, archaeal, beta subunit [Desulfurococcales archaeon ex4484_204]